MPPRLEAAENNTALFIEASNKANEYRVAFEKSEKEKAQLQVKVRELETTQFVNTSSPILFSTFHRESLRKERDAYKAEVEKLRQQLEEVRRRT